jgi:hypothetical protein
VDVTGGEVYRGFRVPEFQGSRVHKFESSRVPKFESSSSTAACTVLSLKAWSLESMRISWPGNWRASWNGGCFGRYLPGDFSKFVRNALGSLNETKDHLDAGLERRYLTTAMHTELRALARRATGTSVNLVKYLDRCKRTWRGRNPPRDRTV